MIWGARDNPDQAKPFLEHLDDLRKTIVRSAALLVAGMLIAIPVAPRVLHLTKVPLIKAGMDPDVFLKVIRVAGGLSIAMRVIFWSGLLISIPFIILVVGSFVFPGLKRKERQAILHSSGFAVALFAGGVCMGYFVTMPVALRMMFRINAWMRVSCEFVELGDYVSFVLRLLIAFGLAFELPVVIVVLGSIGVVSSDQLRARRRHVIVGLLIAAMLLTPPDPLTQIMMAGPLVLLYELCIWVVWFRERARR